MFLSPPDVPFLFVKIYFLVLIVKEKRKIPEEQSISEVESKLKTPCKIWTWKDNKHYIPNIDGTNM